MSCSSPDRPSCLDDGFGRSLGSLLPQAPKGGAASIRMKSEESGCPSAPRGSVEYPSGDPVDQRHMLAEYPSSPVTSRALAVSAGCDPLYRLATCPPDPVPEPEFCVPRFLHCGAEPVELPQQLSAQRSCHDDSKLGSCCSPYRATSRQPLAVSVPSIRQMY